MSDLKGYVCWTREDVVSTIHSEAVVASPAVFLATHTPLRIRKSRINGRTVESSGVIVSEEDVLHDFLERESDTGTLVVPLVGESGSGKSHLVRWIRERIPSGDKYKVIYLEKTRTSLRNVIDDLLRGIDDEEVAKIKDHLRTSGDGMGTEQLSRRLIAELQLALADTKPADGKGDVRSLLGPRGLARVLQDPTTVDWMLEPEKFVPGYAAQLLRDRHSDEPERPPHFSIDDLPIKGVHHKAHPDTLKIVQLLSSRPGLKDAAVSLLNDYLDRAVQKSFSLGIGLVLDTMIKVREIVAREGKEIILLVEDFALIQGVRRDLLDAVTEASIREGNAYIAPMRTLIAVTSGYLQDIPETALTRIGEGIAYNLDIVFDEKDDGAEKIAEFVGRYLNAARVGRDVVEKSGGVHVPVKCQSCPVKITCHEAFGALPNGVGLYPFNRTSLHRLAHAVAPKETPWSFIPREVLKSAIIPIMRDEVERIEKGTFPGPDFNATFAVASNDPRIPNAVRNYLIDVADPEKDRRSALLQFWTENPSNVNGIHQAIADAFSLPPVPDGWTPPEQDQSQKKGPTRSGSLPASIQRKVDNIEEWTHGAVLTQETANDLRKAISRAVSYRHTWNIPPVKPFNQDELREAGWRVHSDTVSIEGAAAENQVTSKARITFRKNPGNGEFFKSVVQLLAGEGKPRGEDTIRFAILADEYGGLLRERVEQSLESADADLVAGIRVSLLGAVLAGKAAPGMSEEELFSAVFHAGDGWARPDAALRSPLWATALTGHLAQRHNLALFLRKSLGRGQGATGKVSVIDAARALPLLQRALDKWDWGFAQDLPKWASAAARPFIRWNEILTDQLDQLSRLRASIRRHYAGGNLAELLEEVDAALHDAQSVGLGGISSAKLQQVSALRARIQGLDQSSVQRLERDLEAVDADPSSVRERVRIAGVLRDERLKELEEFLRICDADLDVVLAAMERRMEGRRNTSAQDVAELLERWAALTKDYEQQEKDVTA